MFQQGYQNTNRIGNDLVLQQRHPNGIGKYLTVAWTRSNRLQALRAEKSIFKYSVLLQIHTIVSQTIALKCFYSPYMILDSINMIRGDSNSKG